MEKLIDHHVNGSCPNIPFCCKVYSPFFIWYSYSQFDQAVMKRRVNLAISVIHHPEILFLDEPTVGVDVQTRFAIIDYLKKLNAGGMTLIYTSHQLYEAESLCRKIAMIDEGKIIVHDSLENLLSKHKQEGLDLEGLSSIKPR